MDNRSIVNMIRQLDTLSEKECRDVIQELIIDKPKTAHRLMNSVSRGDHLKWDVYLDVYENKIKTIKAVRMLTGMGLVDSKLFTEGKLCIHKEPFCLAESVSEEECERIRNLFEDHGESVEITSPGHKISFNPAERFPKNL